MGMLLFILERPTELFFSCWYSMKLFECWWPKKVSFITEYSLGGGGRTGKQKSKHKTEDEEKRWGAMRVVAIQYALKE